MKRTTTENRAKLAAASAPKKPAAAPKPAAKPKKRAAKKAAPPAPKRAVVPAKYKAAYKAAGNAKNCGDWLANQLAGRFNDDAGAFDEPAFTQTMKDNGVPLTGKWAEMPETRKAGWQGRYRMNGRQLLEIRVIRNQCLKLFGETIKPPKAAMALLEARHPATLPRGAERKESAASASRKQAAANRAMRQQAKEATAPVGKA